MLAAVEATVERDWADPDRCFATGFSYGGITTGYLVAESDRFAAAAAEHGVYDFRSAFGTDDSHVWWENDFGLPWENEEGYDVASSIIDVGEVETPLLVTAGAKTGGVRRPRASNCTSASRSRACPRDWSSTPTSTTTSATRTVRFTDSENCASGSNATTPSRERTHSSPKTSRWSSLRLYSTS